MGTQLRAQTLMPEEAIRPAVGLRLLVSMAEGKSPVTTNEDLVSWMMRVAAGDRQAFAALFKHFAPRVKAYLVRCGNSVESAEELTQESMAIVWRKAKTFDPRKAGVSTWIFTIARNQSADRHRRRGQWVVECAESDPEGLSKMDTVADDAASMDERLMTQQRERVVRVAMSHLSTDQALILQLSYFDDRPHSEIARELAIPLGTVKSRIRLAIARLRRHLGGTEA